MKFVVRRDLAPDNNKEVSKVIKICGSLEAAKKIVKEEKKKGHRAFIVFPS